MSARERAHPWWVDPLPPYDSTEWFGDGSVTGKVRLPMCSACERPVHEHHAFVDYRTGWMSPVLCPS